MPRGVPNKGNDEKAGKGGKSAPNGKKKSPVNMPEGFVQHSQDGQKVWVQLDEEYFTANHDEENPMLIVGDLVGRFKRSDRQQAGRKGGSPYFYTIKLHSDLENCAFGAGDEREIVTGKKGTVVAIDEKSALECLKELTDDPRHAFAVAISVTGKKDIGNGQTYWSMNVGKKIIGNRTNAPAAEVGGEEVPF